MAEPRDERGEREEREEREEKEAAPTGADPYQARYMGGDALYHDKIRAPLGFHLLMLLPLVATFGTMIAAHGPLFMPVFASLVLMAAWALFSVLRVSVSREVVYVQYGVFGPKIAVRDIERCEAVDYDWKEYGGWGIRYGRDGSVAYNMLGDRGRAVKIVYRAGTKAKTVLVASRDPERLAAAIQRARAEAAGGVGERRRIEATAGDAAGDEAALEEAAEEEAGAASEEAREGKRQG